MPADRIVTVNVNSPAGYNDDGDFLPGALLVAIRTWATRLDQSAKDLHEEGGARDEVRRDWIIRWDGRIAGASTLDLAVVDGSDTFTINNMVEETRTRNAADRRRRFLKLQGVFST